MKKIGESDFLKELQRKYLNRNFDTMSEKERVQADIDTHNASHGDMNNVDGYDCPVCKNKGMVYFMSSTTWSDGKEHYSETAMYCSCREKRAIIRKLMRLGLYEQLKRCKFANYETTEPWQAHIKDKAISFAENPQGMFFIGGQSGCGKTHLCAAMFGKILLSKEHKGMDYFSWRDRSVELKASINDYQHYQNAIESVKKVEVLYIDDFLKAPIGEETTRPTSADLSLALEIINNRYNAGLTTIISSEWTAFEILDFDEALGGRIFEMGGDYCLNLKKDKSRNYRTKGRMEI